MRTWLISYDIGNSQRRRAVEKCLLAHGTRIQESVFLVRVPYRQCKLLQMTLASLILQNDDAIAWFPMCEPCQSGAQHTCPAASDLHAGYWIA